jgi:hypothetical protein
MALSTLLEIVRRAAGEMGIPRPSIVVGSSDLQVQQLYDFANAVGADLLEHYPWTALQTLATVNTVAGQADYDLPDDFQGFISDTGWDRSNDWRLIGPDSPQRDRELRESGAVDPVRRRFRRLGGIIRINPTPTVDGEELVYEYVSKKWARSFSGAPQEEFAADTDTTIWPARLMVDGIKMEFMSAKGMYADPLREKYEARRDRLVASDLGGGALNMEGCSPSEDSEVFSVPSLGISADDGTELILD